MSQHSQFSLLKKRRFMPFFSTQFLGALNDNIYKNALLLMVAFSATESLPVNSALLVNLAAGLFILPFFLFSSIAGQLADKYEKSLIIRRIKLLEIVIMLLASVFIVTQNYLLMLILLFLMGAQSAFFGPVKYAIIPQHLRANELVGGNALVEMGTFVAILAGTLGAGLLLALPGANYWIAGTVVLLATLGWLVSRGIPTAAAAVPELKINWNSFSQALKILGDASKDRAVFQSILAISWLWALGAAYLTQLPNLANEVFNGTPQVVSVMLVTFIVGVAAGSLICEKLSSGRVEIGIVPIGSIGLTLFGIDLFFTLSHADPALQTGVSQLFSRLNNLHLLVDLCMIGFFAGLFIVPLYAFIQQRTPASYRARRFAALNILNALFMVASAVAGMLFLGVAQLSIAEFFLTISLLNLVVSLYIYKQIPEFALRFVIWMLSHTMYRVTHRALKHIPEEGPAILVCNHVSFVDALIIGGAVKRPVRFVMDIDIYQSKLLHWFFKAAKTIPICSPNRNRNVYRQSFEQISEALRQGNLVCVFPEGKLTRDGKMNAFRPGIETMIKNNPVPVVPMALHGLWGSFFSYKGSAASGLLPRRFWSKVQLVAAVPVPPEAVSAARLEQKVRELAG